MTDQDFLEILMKSPEDDSLGLRYSDWLEDMIRVDEAEAFRKIMAQTTDVENRMLWYGLMMRSITDPVFRKMLCELADMSKRVAKDLAI